MMAVEWCCPLLLAVPGCFSVSEFHFFEQCAIVRHCIITLDAVIQDGRVACVCMGTSGK